MAAEQRLHIYQELLLLALRDERGTPLGSWTTQALAGGVLADLVMAERLTLEGKRSIVVAASTQPTDDPVLDECLRRVSTAKRRAAASTWVSRFAAGKVFHRAAERLCELGVLRAETRHVLHIFSRKVYPEIDPAPEREIVERLREAIFTEREDLEARTIILVSLAAATDLLPAHFPRKDLRTRKQRIDRLRAGEAAGAATAAAVEAVRAAIMVAVLMPAIAGAGS